MNPVIRIQHEDFSLEQEANLLHGAGKNVGAIVTFSGLVRDMHGDDSVTGLYLEHYPGMTEKSLLDIASQAQARWPLLGITIIHRIGELQAGARIVFVGVASEHRSAAFAACDFLMDYLKTQAPFWKKTRNANSAHWVEAKETDLLASKRWT
jgi:molybdopterin synthase catalytic subunit